MNCCFKNMFKEDDLWMFSCGKDVFALLWQMKKPEEGDDEGSKIKDSDFSELGIKH